VAQSLVFLKLRAGNDLGGINKEMYMKDFNHRLGDLMGLTGTEFGKAVVFYTIVGFTLAVVFNGGL
jgi:hypothetical protein